MRSQPQIRVQATPGVRFPMEGRPRLHITDQEPVLVVLSPYYQRALDAGDLVQVPTPAPARKTPSPSSAE